jgi:hypothetical protein
VYYTNGTFHASGTVKNLSGSGGLVQGTHPVHEGMRLNVFLIPPEPRHPLLVKNAKVRWAHGSGFGIDLADLDPLTQAHLAHLALSIPSTH